MKTIRNIALRAISLAVCATACTACVVDSAEVADEMAFAAAIHKSAPDATRTIYQNSVFPTDQTFKVYGYFSDDNFVSTAAYITDETVAYDTDNNWRCASARRYYWPLNGAMKFYAYSPATITPAPTVDSSNGVRIAGYQITTSSWRDDVLYAAVSSMACPPANPKVPVAFTHALSQIGFTARLAADYSNGSNTVSIAINSITLNNIFSTGDFQQNPLRWTSPRGLSSYTVLSGGSVDVGYVSGSGSPVTVGEAVLMIPQTMSSTASLTVSYTVTQVGDDGSYSDVVTSTVPISFAWLINRKVTYALSIALSGITFVASDGEWSSTSGGEIVI